MYRYRRSKEHSTWLYDLVAPVHFAMTARVVGKFSSDQLKQALAWVQQRDRLLRMRIVKDEFGQLWFSCAARAHHEERSNRRGCHLGRQDVFYFYLFRIKYVAG